MMKNILYIFSAIVVTLFSLTSCGLEEPINSAQKADSDAFVEFVGRPVGFNNQDVDTKSEPNGEYDNKVCNCYFLLFNEAGNKIYSTGGPAESIQSYRIPRDLQLSGKLTACYLVNVPEAFAKGITGLTNPSPGNNNNLYIDTAVLEDLVYRDDNTEFKPDSAPMGLTLINGSPCIPMFGKQEFAISNNTIICQVPVKRLFAKVTIDLKVALSGLNEYETLIQSGTHYALQSLTLYNIPTKVKLIENSGQSAWITSTSEYTTAPLQMSTSHTVYNNRDGYKYSFYVPEFYLNPKATADLKNLQEFKPKNYPEKDAQGNLIYPIYIELKGKFIKYSINSADINYKVYLGGDPVDDFSLARNTHYINTLTIQNTNKHKDGAEEQGTLDHRVSTTTINNPVAEAGKAANCYVISQPGKYHFPAYMGAYNNLKVAVPCEGGVDVEILVNKAQYEQTDVSKITIKDEKYDPSTNMISFEVEEAAGVNLVPNGNVVIALVDKARTDQSRKIIWSWHLWFVTDYSGGNESEWATIAAQGLPNSSKKMMNRNLGSNHNIIQQATPGVAPGVYYKYGYKEPFIDGKYYGGGLNGSNTWDPSNDANNSDNTKAVNDPCPPGYRVPSPNDFSSTATNVHAAVYSSFRYWDNGDDNALNDLYFPYSGEIQPGSNNSYSTRSTESASRSYSTIITEEMELDKYMFTNVRYPASNKTGGTYGVLATNDSNAYLQYLFLQYTFRELVRNSTPEILDYKEGKWVSTGWFSGYYDFSGAYTKDVRYSSLSWQAQGAFALIKTFSPKISDLYGTAIISNYQANSNNGYQVRCVQE